ncbi:MAG TPA: hypothetical protein VNH42_05290 [Mariprofundaceae bacterium]|nr:hypothetical protein [Mariprofundaceae bacterium]
MKQLKACLFAVPVVFLAFASVPAMAAGSVTILAPKDGAVLDSGSGIKLSYDVHLSPDGNHLHVYVDDQSPIIDRDVSGCPCSLTLPDLSSGMHEVAVKEATASHDLTGVQDTVKFTVK